MKIIFFGDTHNELKSQNELIKNLDRFKEYDLWLEFLYPQDIENINLKKYDLVLDNLMKNNWSLDYNKNLIKLIKYAISLNINIYPLEESRYSLKSFLIKEGVNGLLFYLYDRISDKPGNCNDRWVKKVKNNQKITKKNQLIFAGKLHKVAINKILNNNFN